MLPRVLLPSGIFSPGVLSRGLLLRLPDSALVQMLVPADSADLPLRPLLHVDYVLGLSAAGPLPPGVLFRLELQRLHPVPGWFLLRRHMRPAQEMPRQLLQPARLGGVQEVRLRILLPRRNRLGDALPCRPLLSGWPGQPRGMPGWVHLPYRWNVQPDRLRVRDLLPAGLIGLEGVRGGILLPARVGRHEAVPVGGGLPCRHLQLHCRRERVLRWPRLRGRLAVHLGPVLSGRVWQRRGLPSWILLPDDMQQDPVSLRLILSCWIDCAHALHGRQLLSGGLWLAAGTWELCGKTLPGGILLPD